MPGEEAQSRRRRLTSISPNRPPITSHADAGMPGEVSSDATGPAQASEDNAVDDDKKTPSAVRVARAARRKPEPVAGNRKIFIGHELHLCGGATFLSLLRTRRNTQPRNTTNARNSAQHNAISSSRNNGVRPAVRRGANRSRSSSSSPDDIPLPPQLPVAAIASQPLIARFAPMHSGGEYASAPPRCLSRETGTATDRPLCRADVRRARLRA